MEAAPMTKKDTVHPSCRRPDGTLRTLYHESELAIVPYGYKMWKIETEGGVWYSITKRAADQVAQAWPVSKISVVREGGELIYYHEGSA